MIIVGLTGGVGSGKTTVAKEFEKLGIPIYLADDEAKTLMVNSNSLKKKIITLFGSQAYVENKLNRAFIANIVFNDESYLQKLNAIVHPAVACHFEGWVKKQQSPYVIKEVAILFETGGHKNCDYVISVVAPKDIRMQRLLQRDITTPEKIEAIMKNQWQDEERVLMSDFVINNMEIANTILQVERIHKQILEKVG